MLQPQENDVTSNTHIHDAFKRLKDAINIKSTTWTPTIFIPSSHFKVDLNGNIISHDDIDSLLSCKIDIVKLLMLPNEDRDKLRKQRQYPKNAIFQIEGYKDLADKDKVIQLITTAARESGSNLIKYSSRKSKNSEHRLYETHLSCAQRKLGKAATALSFEDGKLQTIQKKRSSSKRPTTKECVCNFSISVICSAKDKKWYIVSTRKSKRGTSSLQHEHHIPLDPNHRKCHKNDMPTDANKCIQTMIDTGSSNNIVDNHDMPTDYVSDECDIIRNSMSDDEGKQNYISSPCLGSFGNINSQMSQGSVVLETLLKPQEVNSIEGGDLYNNTVACLATIKTNEQRIEWEEFLRTFSAKNIRENNPSFATNRVNRGTIMFGVDESGPPDSGKRKKARYEM